VPQGLDRPAWRSRVMRDRILRFDAF